MIRLVSRPVASDSTRRRISICSRKQPTVVLTASARELLAGFVWAIGQRSGRQRPELLAPGLFGGGGMEFRVILESPFPAGG